MELQQLNLAELKLGVPLPWNIYDAQGRLLLKRGTVVSNEKQFVALCGRGAFADAAEKRQAAQPVAAAEITFNPFTLWDSLEVRLGQLLQGAPPAAEDFARQMAQLCQLVELLSVRDPDASLAIMHLHDHAKYAISHAIHCALVSNLVARRHQLPPEMRRALVAAALTMNVGMVELQSRLAQQQTPLSPNQRDMIREHPRQSHAWLLAAGVNDAVWLSTVLQHHESEAGDGYPEQIVNPILPAQLLRMSDIFCAKISGRATRRAMSPTQAMRAIFCDSSGINCDLVSSLIKEVGVYPPGTYVKLNNGEQAIVVKRGKSADTPIVMSLVNHQGLPNLQPMRRETDKAEYAISGFLRREKVITRVHWPRLWGY